MAVHRVVPNKNIIYILCETESKLQRKETNKKSLSVIVGSLRILFACTSSYHQVN
jgi:hypothetical protein